jgi:hypothetical protein
MQTKLDEIAARLRDLAQLDGIRHTALADVLVNDAYYIDALTHDVRNIVEKKARRGKVSI